MDLTKRDQDEARQAFLRKSSDDISLLEKDLEEAKPTSKWYWRLVLEILMTAMIIVLLTRLFLEEKVAKIKPSPVPHCMFVPSSSEG
jgi:hypothetical protein